MAINWTWNDQSPHQKQCPRAYLDEADCLCMESTRGNSHIVPAWQDHEYSSECPCFPSIINYRDDDGELVWVHQVFS